MKKSLTILCLILILNLTSPVMAKGHQGGHHQAPPMGHQMKHHHRGGLAIHVGHHYRPIHRRYYGCGYWNYPYYNYGIRYYSPLIPMGGATLVLDF